MSTVPGPALELDLSSGEQSTLALHFLRVFPYTGRLTMSPEARADAGFLQVYVVFLQVTERQRRKLDSGRGDVSPGVWWPWGPRLRVGHGEHFTPRVQSRVARVTLP